jgi:ribosomal protein L37AE/L43A
MDITPSPEFCQACRIVLGGDTPDIVVAALRTSAADRIREIEIEILAGRRGFVGPLDPPAGTLAPLPHMLKAIQEATGEEPSGAEENSASAPPEDSASNEEIVGKDNDVVVEPAPPTEGAGIRCASAARDHMRTSLARQAHVSISTLCGLATNGRPAEGKWHCSKHYKSLGAGRYRVIGGDGDEK